jgi:hypothetical protein
MDGLAFTQITHFPSSLDEARRMAGRAAGPPLSHEQLVATYASQVVLVPPAPASVAR